MEPRGIGTPEMPIVISDDEDEVRRQLIGPSNFFDLTMDDDEEEGEERAAQSPSHSCSPPILELSIPTLTGTDHALGKRKREGPILNGAGPQPHPAYAPLPLPIPPGESKKARKRRRKLERQIAGAQQRLSLTNSQFDGAHQQQSMRTNFFPGTLPPPSSMPPLPIPPPFGMPMNWSVHNPSYLSDQRQNSHQPPLNNVHPIPNSSLNSIPSQSSSFPYQTSQPSAPFHPELSTSTITMNTQHAPRSQSIWEHPASSTNAQSWQTHEPYDPSRASFSSDSTGPPPNSASCWASSAHPPDTLMTSEFGDSFIPLEPTISSKVPTNQPGQKGRGSTIDKLLAHLPPKPPPTQPRAAKALPTGPAALAKVPPTAPSALRNPDSQQRPLLPPLQPNFPFFPNTSSSEAKPTTESAMDVVLEKPPHNPKASGSTTNAASIESPSNEMHEKRAGDDPLPSIGMPPQSDPHSKHGLFVISLPKPTRKAKQPPPPHVPNPATTLVLENIPKVKRTPEFVRTWAKRVIVHHGPAGISAPERKKLSATNPVFCEVDKKGAKALVEFSSSELARAAWSSPRLGRPPRSEDFKKNEGADGKVSKPLRLDLVRAWWYRVPGVGADAGVGELEEGEIEEDEATISPISHVSELETPKKAKNTRPSEEELKERAKLAVKPFCGDEPGPIGTLVFGLGLVRVPSVEPYQPMPKQLLTRLRRMSEAKPPPPPPPPLVPPVIPIPQAPASSPSGMLTRPGKELPKGPTFRARQRELEERLAQSRIDLKQAAQFSRPVDLTPELAHPTIEQSNLGNVAIATPPEVPATVPVQGAEPSQDVSQEDRLAMEDRLRKLVLMSKRKPKLSAPPVAQVQPPPTPPPVSEASALVALKPPVAEVEPLSASPPSLAAPLKPNGATPSLDDLAVTFITETLQTSQNVLPAPKEDLASKQKRLEAHIAECKHLMSRIAAASTRAEKDVLMTQLREKTRLMKESTTTSDKPTPEPVVRSVVTRWPESRQDVGLIDISDEEEEDMDTDD